MLGVGLVLIDAVTVGVGVEDWLAVCVAVVDGTSDIVAVLDGVGDAVAADDSPGKEDIDARGLIHCIFDAGVDVHVTSCPRLETVVSTGW